MSFSESLTRNGTIATACGINYRDLNLKTKQLTKVFDKYPTAMLHKPQSHYIQAVHPMGIWQNSLVLQLSSEVRMQPCDTVAKCSIPCTFYGSFKMCKISASDCLSMSIRRSVPACADDFLAIVTEGVVHSVCKVVTQSSYGDIRQVEANGRLSTVSQDRT